MTCDYDDGPMPCNCGGELVPVVGGNDDHAFMCCPQCGLVMRGVSEPLPMGVVITWYRVPDAEMMYWFLNDADREALRNNQTIRKALLDRKRQDRWAIARLEDTEYAEY